MPVHFLNSPVGVACLLVIGATSLFNIYAYWVDDGLFGRLLHMAIVLTCVAGVIRYADSYTPQHIASTLIVLFTAMGARNLCVRAVRLYRYRKIYAKSKHL